MRIESPRVLVVDDDASLRLLIRVNLELEGFQVEEAATIEAAEAVVAASPPDAVLLDVHLGGQETLSLLARLRADGLRVALVTGSVDVNEYRDAADDVLSKPFTPRALVDLARRLARLDA